MENNTQFLAISERDVQDWRCLRGKKVSESERLSRKHENPEGGAPRKMKKKSIIIYSTSFFFGSCRDNHCSGCLNFKTRIPIHFILRLALFGNLNLITHPFFFKKIWNSWTFYDLLSNFPHFFFYFTFFLLFPPWYKKNNHFHSRKSWPFF